MNHCKLKQFSLRLLSKIASGHLNRYYWTWATITRLKKTYSTPAVKKMILTISSDGSSPARKKPGKKSPILISASKSTHINPKNSQFFTSKPSPNTPEKALTPTYRGSKGFSVKSRTPTKKSFDEPLAVVSANLPTSNLNSLFSRSLTPNF